MRLENELSAAFIRPFSGWEIVMQDEFGEHTWQFSTETEARKKLDELIASKWVRVCA